jgi:hypothetical protein
MQEWWAGLAGITQVFYGMAAFFSVFFLWQIIGAFMGVDGEGMDGDVDVGEGFDLDDVAESADAFKVLSLRSVITFFTLFSWGSALYTTSGVPAVKAMSISAIWGMVGMFAIAGIFYTMGKLAETGTKDMEGSLDQIGTVYLDIPAEGFGEVKVIVNNVPEHIRAKSMDGEVLPAGTQVRVVQVVNQTLVGVQKLTNKGDS